MIETAFEKMAAAATVQKCTDNQVLPLSHMWKL